MFNFNKHLTVKDIALITLLTALSVGGSYALIGLPNINLMDIVIFVTSFVFGMPIGVFVGVLSWSIYGFINPLGFILPIWLATIIGESLFGLVGGILGIINPNPKQTLRFTIEMGLWGLGLTIIYDLFTNIVFAHVFNVPIISAIVSGWLFPPWFGILHEVSNLILFSSAVYPLSKAIRITRGGE